MSTITLALVSTFALTAPATAGQQGLGLGIQGTSVHTEEGDEGGGDEGDCYDLDVDADVSCGLVAGLDLWAECNPLAVEAACYAKLGADCGLDVFAECTAELVADCQAALELGGAVFCEGEFKGGASCWDELGGDHEDDGDECVDGEEDVDIDLDIDLCLDLGLDLNLDCEVEVGAECQAACDPISVQAWCEEELGDDCTKHEFAQCQGEVMAQCWADCEVDGAVFCDGEVYVGADICLGIDIGGIGIHL